MRKYSIIFFVNARLKLASKIPVSNPYFKQYVFYQVPNRERKELCNEERKNVFCLAYSQEKPSVWWYFIKYNKECLGEDIWHFKTCDKFSSQTRCLSCVNPILISGDEYLFNN